jgi:hypothetical protein
MLSHPFRKEREMDGARSLGFIGTRRNLSECVGLYLMLLEMARQGDQSGRASRFSL